MQFPKEFLWSCSTASYQNEGTPLVAGGGASVWDIFCRRTGAVFGGHTGDVACDHYNRWQDDVDLMADMGLTAYRFSISWPRVLPDGVGRTNPDGIAFYDRLVDALLEKGITPLITLFHWDYPYELFCRGAWLNRNSADWFADYARLMVDKLSDRVSFWPLFNEPANFIGSAFAAGNHAPGLKLDPPDIVRMCHHVLLAHGKGVQAMRAAARQPLSIGWALGAHVGVPASGKPEDIEAARQWFFRMPTEKGKPLTQAIRWWYDPIFAGRYPEDGLAMYERDLPPGALDDLPVIAQPLDYCGLNIYMGTRIRADADGRPLEEPLAPGAPLNILQWPIVPEALYWGPRFFHEKYGLPIQIQEVGAPGADTVSRDGCVHDPQRVDFLDRYLSQMARAVHDGVDIRACSLWTLMDNFEWSSGYYPRFGLVHVDFETQTRTPKDSFYWYRDTIAQRGANLEYKS